MGREYAEDKVSSKVTKGEFREVGEKLVGESAIIDANHEFCEKRQRVAAGSEPG